MRTYTASVDAAASYLEKHLASCAQCSSPDREMCESGWWLLGKLMEQASAEAEQTRKAAEVAV